MKGVFRPHYRDYKLNQAKIDDSVGMCGSESDYDSCWSRICSPDKSTALRDVLRGLLVLIALAIVVTIVFLLCFFLLNDMEQKEEALVDTLIKDFSTGNRVDVAPEFPLKDENKLPKYPYDIEPPSEQEKNSGAEILWENSHGNPLQDNVSESPSEFNAEDDLYLSFGNVDLSKALEDDSEIANTEGSFVNAHKPETKDDSFHIETELIEAESTKECVSLRLPLCSGSMPWTVTTFPNFVNNINVDQLTESLMYFQSIIVGSRCSTRAAEYTCAILEPACGPEGIPLPPCKTFCQDIVRSCSEFLIAGNENNEAFNCGRFPDSRNPNVCVDINSASLNLPPANLNEKQSFVQTNSDDGSNILNSFGSKTDDKQEPEFNNTHNSTLSEFKHLEEKDMLEESKGKDGPEDVKISKSSSEATEPPVFICDHTKFLCDDGSDCLGEEAVCDGIQHCLDNSDELNCTQPECSVDDFACATTKYCIPKTWVCDGADDCRDNSDEVKCPDKSQLDDNNDDSLLAQASDLTPGLVNVDTDSLVDSEGSESIPQYTEDKNESFLSSSLENQFEFKTNVPDEIIQNFKKFGETSEAKDEINNVQGINDNNLKEINESKESIIKEETLESNDPPPLDTESDRPTIRRRKPLRPDLLRFNKQRQKQNIKTNSNDQTNIVSVSDNDNESIATTESEKQNVISNTRTAIPIMDNPNHIKRINSGGTERILSRRPINNRLRDRLQNLKNNQESSTNRMEEHKTEESDKKKDENNLESVEEKLSQPEEIQNRPIQGTRRRERRPVPVSESDTVKDRIELPPARKSPTRRPVSIIRRRPTAEIFSNPETSDEVELLREKANIASKQDTNNPDIAQPITLPEQIIPSNMKVQDDSTDEFLTNSDDFKAKSPNKANENNYNYDISPENSEKSQNFEYEEQYENNKSENENTEQYATSPQETPVKNYNAFPQRYNNNAPNNIYKNSPNPYESSNISPVIYNSHDELQRQRQHQQQQGTNSQTYFHLGQYEGHHGGGHAAQNYYAMNPQASEHYETPTYSQQTQNHQPSYPENVYHYANPSFPYSRNSQIYRDDYRQQQQQQ